MNLKKIQEYLKSLQLSLPEFILRYGTTDKVSLLKRQKKAYYRASRIRKGLDDLTIGEKKILEIKKLLLDEEK